MVTVRPETTAREPKKDKQLNRSLRETPPAFNATTIEEAKDLEDIFARQAYGKLIVWGYLLLLAAVIFIPMLLWELSNLGKSVNFASGLNNVKDFTTSMFAGLAGLSGLVGLVIGLSRQWRARG